MDHLFPYPKMGHSFTEILEDPLTRKLLGHDAVHAEKTPFVSGVTSRLTFLLNDATKHLSFLKVGYSALEAFLQANATGPPLDFDSIPVVFPEVYRDENLPALKKELLDSLSVDGDAIYALTPRIELFWLAKVVMSNSTLAEVGFNGRRARFRVNCWHQKLLQEKSDTLQSQIYADADVLEHQLGGRLQNRSAAAEEHFIEFLLERAAIRIFYGDDVKARDDLKQAAKIRHFQFALTGALGKRTKYQEKDLSQLVVLAKSRDHEPETYSSRKSSRADGSSSRKSSHTDPHALSPTLHMKSPSIQHHGPVSPTSAVSSVFEHERPVSPLAQWQDVLPLRAPENVRLNDDTLLEHVAFKPGHLTELHLDSTTDEVSLSPLLAQLDPSDQPLLFPVDSIILLSVASSIQNTSPADGLTREETLPYATRVLEGGSSNWQVYTQALLVRSRIEGYKARTMERGLLQLQALVDQVIAETTGATIEPNKNGAADAESTAPTTFLPRASISESASVAERLKYIHQLCPPLRWELEAELAQRWTQLGGLRSALEIYERLQMHAEIALCLASTDREAEAKRLLRSLLFKSSDSIESDSEADLIQPTPNDAPRLLSILGDISDDPKYYTLSWQVSRQRYARAQRSLGRYHIQRRNPRAAAEAYKLALQISRIDGSLWFALGCAQLELEDWPGAVESFTRVVQLEDSDAEAWSNLAVALLRLPPPAALATKTESPVPEDDGEANIEEDVIDDEEAAEPYIDDFNPYKHTFEALRALRRAATLKREDARIWDNYLTVAASIPPSAGTPWSDIIQAMSQVIRLRSKKEGEGAIDIKILEALTEFITRTYVIPSSLEDNDSNGTPSQTDSNATPEPSQSNPTHETLSHDEDNIAPSDKSKPQPQSQPPTSTSTTSQPPPPRLPFLLRSYLTLIDTQIHPLASSSPPLLTLLSRISLFRHRPSLSLSYAEKSWRATTTQPTIYDTEAGWTSVVSATLSLVDAYENLGDKERERTGGKVEGGWRAKAKMAVRGVMGRGRENWEDSNGWEELKARTEGLAS